MHIIIKKIIREVFSLFVFYSGILSIYRFLTSKKITILNYHDIKGEDFERHVIYLNRHFKIISLDECINTLKEHKIESNYLVITFDDGYQSFYKEIYPVLKKYDVNATIFLPTDFIGSKKLFWFDLIRVCFEEKNTENFKKSIEGIRVGIDSIIGYLNNMKEDEKIEKVFEIIGEKTVDYYNKKTEKYHILNWEQIGEMDSNLVCFGSHTMSHPILTKISLEKVKKEIFGSKDEIEKKIGRKIKLFAYPNGDISDFNDKIIEILKEAGFDCAVTTIDGYCKIGDDLFKLKRKVVDGEFSIPCLVAKIVGLWIPLSRKKVENIKFN